MDTLNLKRYQPVGLRIWHWLNAFVIFGLLGTVLLRKTFLSWRSNSVLVEAKIRGSGVAIDHDLAVEVAKAIRDVMWEWHIILGFALVAMFLMRKVVALTTKKFPLQEAIDGIRAISLTAGSERADVIHFAGVKLSHVGFYLTVAFMSVSGLGLYFGKSLEISKPTMGVMKESHEIAMWFIVAFVVAHLAGVVLAELGRHRGVVSDMIHGGDKN